MKIFEKGLLAVLIAMGGIAVTLGNASAYVVCNRFGDCWHTDTRVNFRGVHLIFHSDKWWDRHKGEGRYAWHEIESGHDWHHGYWDHDNWHPV